MLKGNVEGYRKGRGRVTIQLRRLATAVEEIGLPIHNETHTRWEKKSGNAKDNGS